MTAHRSRTWTLAVVVLIFGTPCASAIGTTPEYHVTRLDDLIEAIFPGVTFPSSDARALNENGDLVGEAPSSDNGHRRGWIYTVEHGVVALPVLPGDARAEVRDVSERDVNGDVLIAGSSTSGIEPWTAVVWRFSTVTGEVLEMRNIGLPPGFDESTAVAVNNDGIVVGTTASIGPFTNWKYDYPTDVLETFDFPWHVTDLNNFGQVCGGSYRGDLFGNSVDLSETYEPGDVMPSWAIENGGISAGWHKINDLGWLVGRAGTGISDGAGHTLVAVVRYADPIGWTGMPAVSHLALAGGINDLGDFIDASGGAYFEDMGQTYSLNALLAPEFPNVEVYKTQEINDHRQVAGHQAHAFLLTPLGEMIIPGDVNGDVQVNLDDHCAWTGAPIDLDGDADVDADDEQWLLDRLAVFGFTVVDCNGNGVGDRCDITSAFSLDCDENGVPDDCQSDCNADGVPDVCEPDCNGNGAPDACDIGAGTSDDCNGNGIPDECDEGGVTNVMNVFATPIQILQSDHIEDDVLVIDAGIVEDLDFTIDISYRIGYLSVYLSHNGTTVTLIDRPGAPDGEHDLGNGQFGYAPGILDDEGAGGPVEDQGNFGQPVAPIVSPPAFTPNEPLSAFDGMPSEGLWTVTVETTERWSPADEFYGWGLTITRAAAAPCTPATGDIDGDGSVGLSDLILVLAAWGPCPTEGACPSDLAGDGMVGLADLLMVLSRWGPASS